MARRFRELAGFDTNEIDEIAALSVQSRHDAEAAQKKAEENHAAAQSAAAAATAATAAAVLVGGD